MVDACELGYERLEDHEARIRSLEKAMTEIHALVKYTRIIAVCLGAMIGIDLGGI